MIRSITVRLRDLEADALDRLSYVYGVSKNTLINALIAREYKNFIHGEETTPPEEELFKICDDKDLPDEYEDTLSATWSEIGTDRLKRLVKCYDYAIESSADAKEIDALNDGRSEVLEILLDR